MKQQKIPSRPKTFLWWIAIIALGISGALFYFLKSQAQYDASIEETRMFVPMIGIIIAGICVIAATAERWFYPK